MSKLAIDLTYHPSGGALAQIKEIINSVGCYNFEKVAFYLTSDNMHLFDDVDTKDIVFYIVGFSNRSIIIRTIWAQFVLPFSLIINNIDVLFCPGNISPILNTKKKVQWIGTVGPFEDGFISSFSIKDRIVLYVTKYLMVFSSITSDLVIFESNYTKNLFIEKYKQKSEKSAVLHIGNDEYFKPISQFNSKITDNFRSKNYILTVSHLYPYKNIELLIDAFYNSNLAQRDLYLLIAGSITDKQYYNKLKYKVEQYGLSDRILLLGNIKKNELREMYSQCYMLVFTSPFENFAYTLVEAMSCSVAIIATNTTAMPETCGDAVLYFSPDSEKELTACIFTYLNDEKIRLEHKSFSQLKSKEYEVYSVINEKTNVLLENLTSRL
jgi:glycosyltransferase involved in cell wall biosynthesis